MKRTTVMLPMDLKIRAEEHARKTGVSLGRLIREALEATLRGLSREPEEDPLFSDGAVHRDEGPRDLAKNHDNYLYGEPF